jgi:hypothetical protein
MCLSGGGRADEWRIPAASLVCDFYGIRIAFDVPDFLAERTARQREPHQGIENKIGPNAVLSAQCASVDTPVREKQKI